MATTHVHTTPADVAYAAAYSGAIGGSAIALFFLARDIVIGAPLYTPTLLGSAMFLGEIPSTTGALRLDLVAVVSVLHLLAFGMVGTLFAVVLGRLEELRDRPVVLAGGIFATLTAGIVAVDMVFLNGIVQAMNPVAVVAGNAVAAICMSIFYRYAFRDVGAARPPA